MACASEYASLAAKRLALQAKAGQGRPVFRTEQRSAEKIARLVPAASRVPASADRQPTEAAQPTAKTAAAQGAAAALPSGAGHVIALQRCGEGAHGARRLDGGAMLAATAGRRQALRPAFKPGGAAGWRMGQPLPTVSPRSSFRTADASSCLDTYNLEGDSCGLTKTACGVQGSWGWTCTQRVDLIACHAAAEGQGRLLQHRICARDGCAPAGEGRQP